MAGSTTTALFQILVAGLIIGAGLPALFAIGVRLNAEGVRRRRARRCGRRSKQPGAHRDQLGASSPLVLVAVIIGVLFIARDFIGHQPVCTSSGAEAEVTITRRPDRAMMQPGNRLVEVDAVNGFLAKIVAWLNAGYPEGVPGPDRVPLLALLTPRLTNDEVKAVAQDLMDRGEFDHIDIGVLITQITDELPTRRGRRTGPGAAGRQGLAARRSA